MALNIFLPLLINIIKATCEFSGLSQASIQDVSVSFLHACSRTSSNMSNTSAQWYSSHCQNRDIKGLEHQHGHEKQIVPTVYAFKECINSEQWQM